MHTFIAQRGAHALPWAGDALSAAPVRPAGLPTGTRVSPVAAPQGSLPSRRACAGANTRVHLASRGLLSRRDAFGGFPVELFLISGHLGCTHFFFFFLTITVLPSAYGRVGLPEGFLGVEFVG